MNAVIDMKLADTSALMVSSDYKDRFKAEYYQTLIRLQKLKHMLLLWDNQSLDYEPESPRMLFDLQVKTMEAYIAILEARAIVEKIEL